jgi:hypothetical protein
MRAKCSLKPASLISIERWADFIGDASQDQDSQVSRKKRRGTTRVQNRGIANASLEVGRRGLHSNARHAEWALCISESQGLLQAPLTACAHCATGHPEEACGEARAAPGVARGSAP